MTVTIPPHLSHRPLCGGLPIPAIAVRHRVGHRVLALSSWPGYDLMTVWEGDSGPPDFSKYDDEAYRACMVERRCHVCWGLPTCTLVCVPNERKRREVEGGPATLIVQPWVCAPCLGFAVWHYPTLMAAVEEGRGLVLSITEHTIVSTLWNPVTPEDPVSPEWAKVLSGFQILPTKAEVQALPEWAETVG